MINSFASQFNAYKQQQYSKIYHHELQHQSTAGSLAGPIVIEKDNNGVPVGGHVEIKMPTLDKNNPDETIKHASTVIQSALAPDEPSVQDLKVAGEAKAVLAEAKDVKEDNKKQVGSKLNYIA